MNMYSELKSKSDLGLLPTSREILIFKIDADDSPP